MNTDVTPKAAAEGTQDQPVLETNSEATETVETLKEKLAAAEARAQANSQEAQKYRKEQAKAKADAEAADRKRLEAEGNWKVLAEQEAEKARAHAEALKETQAKFAFSQIRAALETEAVKNGCVDTTALVKLTDLSDIKIGEDFSVDQEALRAKVQDAMKTKTYLFAKQAPSVRDASPASGKPPAAKAVKDMSSAELIEMYKKLNG